MMWKKNISFVVIFSLWTSASGIVDNFIGNELDKLDPVSGKIHKIYGQWSVNVEKCWWAGEQKYYPMFVLGNLNSGNLSYDSLDEDAFIKAGGDIELYTKPAGTVRYESLILDHYIQEENGKVYFGELHLETTSGWATQTCHVKLTLVVLQNGDLYLETYVLAGSWGAVSCAHTNCAITSLTIRP